MKLEKVLRKVRVLRKARNGLIGIGLSGALLLGAGCASDWDAIAFTAGALARDKDKTEEQRESAAYLEQIAKEQAQKDHERDIADRSRDEGDEVNVYVGEQEKEKEIVYVERQEDKQKLPELNRYFFACNYWKDFNNNGIGDYPDEYVGIKNKFRDDEKIILVSHDEKAKKGQLWKIELYNPSGEIIHKGKRVLPYSNVVMKTGENVNMMNRLIQNSSYGNFKAVWYLDDKYTGSTEFEIIQSNERKNKQQLQQNQATLEGFFAYNEWKDLNHNGQIEKNELSGLGKKVFNLNEENLWVHLQVPNKMKNITFRSWTNTGELIGETLGNHVSYFTGLSSNPSAGDFMDKLGEAGPGNYRISATLENGTTYSLDIKITE